MSPRRAAHAAAGDGADELPFPVPIGAILGLARLTEHALDEVGLSLAQYRLLGFCAITPRTPSEVAIWLSVRKQSVTRQLDALVQAGLLDRTVDPGDRRRLLHGATAAGWEVLDRGQAVVDDYLALVLATVDPPDRDLVQAGLAAAGRALNRAWDLIADTDGDPAEAIRRA
jgi:DNA-binding MarR family transcriptional regulator